MTPWASIYDLASGKFRAMMRITATDPVVQYEWSTDGGTISFAASAAQGQLDFTSNPANNDTLTLGSSLVTFLTVGSAVTLAPSSTVTITNASPGVITWTGHGLAAGTPVVFSTTGALPTGLVPGTTYFVSSSGLATNSFEVSDTFAHAIAGINNINTSSAGSGVQTATAPSTVMFPANGLAAGANVAFTTTGTLPAGIVSGQVYFVSPTLLETGSFEIATTMNGTPLIFGGPKSGSAQAFTGNTVPVGLTIGATLANLLSFLNASADPQISLATYALGGAEISIIYDTTSINGNLFALAASSSGVSASAPTLYGAGGVLTMTAPIGDIEAFQGLYVYDCRFEIGSPPTTVVQMFGGTLTFLEGVTR
jgi:hypothetical protein